ncbi:DivIVA domain-containing protein [Sediminivirga luteola]|uniref:Cell wall synthesis protein Wag31 n=1 Tax=Sediminivirga luteola TaxID=1774748 RepID=A0A8J2XLC8_9MICO|nr:DivIVA domain-containing protein [Sediminivirga luteola]GGA21026.1 cell division protein DivIVA [Sediminivirga luteola]
MALTPEDVVNKRFQHVKFRDGYDQDEVDDFLDEVVVELRRLYQENDELRQKLSAAEQKLADLGESGAAPAVQSPEPQEAPEVAAPAAPADPAATAAFPAPFPQEAPAAAPAPAEPAPAVSEPVVAPAAPSSPATPGDAHGLIELAQKLHDEHVARGEQRAHELISEAEQRAKEIVGAAETKRRETLESLETEQAKLESSIDTLRNFERQYRTRLKSYLTDQLRDLESYGSLVPETLDGQQNNSGI